MAMLQIGPNVILICNLHPNSNIALMNNLGGILFEKCFSCFSPSLVQFITDGIHVKYNECSREDKHLLIHSAAVIEI